MKSFPIRCCPAVPVKFFIPSWIKAWVLQNSKKYGIYNIFFVPRQYLPQPHGRVRNERPAAARRPVRLRASRFRRCECGGARQSRLPASAPQAGRARDRCDGKTARLLQAADYQTYDLLIGMDRRNLEAMRRICGSDPDHKLCLLLDFTAQPRDVADPWYTRDFEQTWLDITAGCTALLQTCFSAQTGPL